MISQQWYSLLVLDPEGDAEDSGDDSDEDREDDIRRASDDDDDDTQTVSDSLVSAFNFISWPLNQITDVHFRLMNDPHLLILL